MPVGGVENAHGCSVCVECSSIIARVQILNEAPVQTVPQPSRAVPENSRDGVCKNATLLEIPWRLPPATASCLILRRSTISLAHQCLQFLHHRGVRSRNRGRLSGILGKVEKLYFEGP